MEFYDNTAYGRGQAVLGNAGPDDIRADSQGPAVCELGHSPRSPPASPWRRRQRARNRSALPALQGVFVNEAPAPLADFTLTDHQGRSRNFSSLRGSPALVFFGFAHCPNICPTTLANLKALHEAEGGALKSARVVLVSVDGERDTPAALKSYLAPLSPDFIGLTGDPKADRQDCRAVLRRVLQGTARQGRQLQRHALDAGVRGGQGRPAARFLCRRLARGHGEGHKAPDQGRRLGLQSQRDQSSAGSGCPRLELNAARNAPKPPAAIAFRIRAIRSR